MEAYTAGKHNRSLCCCGECPHYEYDAYGKILVSENKGSGESIASLNPIKYKGYYYDTEIAMYRLETRFYDPEIGRFLNADDLSLLQETPSSLGDKNLYAYCDNNPVTRKDSNGEFWHVVAGAVVGACVDASIEVAAQIKTNGKVDDWGAIGKAAVNGAVSGVIGFSKVKLLGQAAYNVGKSLIENAVDENADKSMKGYVRAGLGGVVTTLIGGKGDNLKSINQGWMKVSKKIVKENRRANKKYANKQIKRYRSDQGRYERAFVASFSRYTAGSIYSSYRSRR